MVAVGVFRVLLAVVAGVSARRVLQAEDLSYGFDAFNTRFNTRARHIFAGDDDFHRRLFEHESALPHEVC